MTRGKVILLMSNVGYKTQTLEFVLRGDTAINIKLKLNIELQTVEISAKKQDRIENRTQISQVTVPIVTIKKIPALLGEVDVLKALQLLPGVQANGLYLFFKRANPNGFISFWTHILFLKNLIRLFV